MRSKSQINFAAAFFAAPLSVSHLFDYSLTESGSPFSVIEAIGPVLASDALFEDGFLASKQ